MTVSEGRLQSLDAYRGFIMLAMTSAGLGMGQLLDDPSWGWLAHQFEHEAWEGCTFWDLIQPAFMFMVGVSMPLAFAVRQARGESWGRQFLHVLRRCALLCVIGIVLDSLSQRVPTLQFIRVLQQIAIGYCLAFFILRLDWRFQAAAIVIILLAHTLAYVAYGESGTGGPWERDHNLGSAIDALLHTPFAGLSSIRIFPASVGGYVTMNAFSSTATILFGVLAGKILQTPWSRRSKLLSLLTLGTVLVAVGLATTFSIPMVKRLWTSSFVLYSAGWTYLMMAAFYGMIDVLGWRRWSFPFVVVGMNSIFMYVAASLLSGPLQRAWRTAFGGLLDSMGPWEPVVITLFVSLSLWFLCYVLYRWAVFLKV